MKYFIITYGCQMNKSDSERIAGRLKEKNNQLVNQLSQADQVIINVCSVRQSAIDRVYGKIRQIRKNHPQIRIILTGCILEKDKKQLIAQVDEIWPAVSLEGPVHYQSQTEAFVPIMTGCNNFCTYCAVPYTRGREKYRPAQTIIEEVKRLIKQGYQNITLLGQNVNSYQDKKMNFAQLLAKLAQLPGQFQLSFLTSHPKDISDQLIKTIAASKKINKTIHLPLQSGDNQILKKMNRHYRAEDYQALIKKIRQKIPQAQFSTDVIVGFPGETRKQFKKTLKLFKQIKFSQAYVACYSPRPGTAAAKLKDNVSCQEKKRRQRLLLNLVKEKAGIIKSIKKKNLGHSHHQPL